jgi:hypothetical protein
MRVSRYLLIALVAVVVSAAAPRSASAAPWQLCLTLDQPTEGAHAYFLNFVSQGNAIVVSGSKGHGPDDHGPAFGALAKPPSALFYELGLTVTIKNGGDYNGYNTENVVFQFVSNGAINYKRWLNSSTNFTQGLAFAFTCPAS